MYALTTSRGAPPVEQIKNPLDQIVRSCRPQQQAPYSSSNTEAVLDLSFPIIFERHLVCRLLLEKKKSLFLPLSSVILHWTSRASVRKFSNRNVRFSEVSILRRNFVQKTMW